MNEYALKIASPIVQRPIDAVSSHQVRLCSGLRTIVAAAIARVARMPATE